LYFGDRVAVLNDFIYQTGGSIYIVCLMQTYLSSMLAAFCGWKVRWWHRRWICLCYKPRGIWVWLPNALSPHNLQKELFNRPMCCAQNKQVKVSQGLNQGVKCAAHQTSFRGYATQEVSRRVCRHPPDSRKRLQHKLACLAGACQLRCSFLPPPAGCCRSYLAGLADSACACEGMQVLLQCPSAQFLFYLLTHGCNLISTYNCTFASVYLVQDNIFMVHTLLPVVNRG
jgi:hypothetical protein